MVKQGWSGSRRMATKARLGEAAASLRSQREGLSAGRREGVYKTDPGLFLPDLRAGTHVPLLGTRARAEWDAAIVADVVGGRMSYKDAAKKYKTSQATIGRAVAGARDAQGSDQG